MDWNAFGRPKKKKATAYMSKDERVKKVRYLYGNKGYSMRAIAAELNMSQSVVRNIVQMRGEYSVR